MQGSRLNMWWWRRPRRRGASVEPYGLDGPCETQSRIRLMITQTPRTGIQDRAMGPNWSKRLEKGKVFYRMNRVCDTPETPLMIKGGSGVFKSRCHMRTCF